MSVRELALLGIELSEMPDPFGDFVIGACRVATDAKPADPSLPVVVENPVLVASVDVQPFRRIRFSPMDVRPRFAPAESTKLRAFTRTAGYHR